VAVAAVAGVVVLVLAGLLVRNLADSGKGGGSGGSTGGTDGPSTSASAPTSGAADPDALPASWVGTWTGSGPGDPAGSATAPRTDSFKVTLTLVAGRRGDRLGRQVSNAHDADTGADDGCTETLQLTSMNGSTATFTAVSARPTDSSGAGVCLPGNVYQVTMAGGKLHLGAGSQAPGAPSTFTKVG